MFSLKFPFFGHFLGTITQELHRESEHPVLLPGHLNRRSYSPLVFL